MTFQDRFAPQCLLWDIDGTLIDTISLIVESLDFAYRKYMGRTLPPADIRALIGIPLKAQIKALGDPTEHGVDPVAMEADIIRYYEAGKSREKILQPAIDALIAGKRAGCATALVTSKNLAELDNTLPRLGVADYLDLIVSADDVKNPKPDPEGVRLAVAKLGVDPRRTVFIGDTIYDLQAGREGGVLVCGVTYGAGTRESLLTMNPEFLCDDPADLTDALGIAALLEAKV